MCNIFRIVTIIILLGLIVGIVSAVTPDQPIKKVILGENIDEIEAFNIDVNNIVPEDTLAVCLISSSASIICDTRNTGTGAFNLYGEFGHPALPGDYYAVTNSSPYAKDTHEALRSHIASNTATFRATHVRLYTVLPAPTPEPTPIPTPTIGAIIITSNPEGATIFLDNVIKGITPLTLSSVSNGDHNVLLRLDSYKDSSKSIAVLGDTQTINFVMELKSSQTPTPINTATTGATTIPTTISVTTSTTTGVPTTQVTMITTTATPKPTRKVNYSATIATMQSQIAEQNAKIDEQESWIDQILRFLGLK